MTTVTEIRQRAIQLVDRLPQEMLFEALEFLETLSLKATQRREDSFANPEESSWLQVVQRRLTSEEQNRLDYLRQKNENGEISKVERNELLNYIERIECEDAERAAALIKLAEIRQVNIATLIEEFQAEEIKPNVV